jgi:uncharacterized protein (TIGR02271 family)
MYTDQREIPLGTIVYDVAGDKIGTVSENNVQDAYLVVEKGWLFHKDFYVPLSAIGRADAGGVYLLFSTSHLEDAQFDSPPAAGATPYAAPVAGSSSRTVVDSGDDIRVPVREEELVVGTRQEEAGQVHIHKDVVTEQQTVQVPLQHERVTVERVAFSGDPATTADAFVARDIEVPVMGEEAVVSKRMVGVEDVVIHKDVVTEQQTVDDTVRKERVVVDGVDASGQPTTAR